MPKKPFIVFVITRLDLGGAQKICLELFEHFKTNSALISSAGGFLFDQYKLKQNFILSKFMTHPISPINDFLCIFELFWIFYKLKRKHQEIVIHSHCSKAGFLARIAAVFLRVKVIHTVHGFVFHDHQNRVLNLLFKFLEQIGTFCSDTIVCVSEKDLLLGSKLFWGFKKKAILIRAAVDDRLFKTSNNSQDDPLILGTVSCLKPQKNVVQMIKIFSMLNKILPNKNMVLEIIGDGNQKVLLQELVYSLGINDKVVFHGWRHPAQVNTIMSRWNIFLMTSLWEGLPCALVQARLKKIPAICFDTGGINEVLKDGLNGYLIAQKDERMMLERLVLVLQDCELRKKLAGFDDQLQDYFLVQMIKKHQHLYSADTQAF